MVAMAHQLLRAQVYHQRCRPKKNRFNYRVFYTVLDLQRLHQGNSGWFSASRAALLRYRHQDHGARDGSDAIAWARHYFLEHRIPVDDLRLMTMPRMLGYLFNPVSFWLGFCAGKLHGVLCAVNNTFGQSHAYLCYKENYTPITAIDWFEAVKEFHVSPFYPCAGKYAFRFDVDLLAARWKIIIHYWQESRLELVTAVSGTLQPMSKRQIFIEFLRTPGLTFKVILLIHYQALKLWLKKSTFYPLPEKKAVLLTKALHVQQDR